MPPLAELSLDPEVADAVTTSLWSHAYTVGGVLLALFALARLATEGSSLLDGRRIGLLCNPTAVDAQLEHAIELLGPQLKLTALFGPEHGVRGDAQDMISVDTAVDAKSKLPVHSLYGHTEASLTPTAAMLDDIDVMVYDIQDVGARYYTFVWTMVLAMRACAAAGKAFVVLDRPNPITGLHVEGSAIEPGYESFVGLYPIALRHGLTIAELARLFNEQFGLGAALETVAMEGWSRGAWWDATGLPWVMPSPNMPTLDTAIVYPGMVLFEGTLISEGRGTTRPFELVGHPQVTDAESFADGLNALGLLGVHFRPAYFEPTFQKHARVTCGGCQLHVTDRERFRSVDAAVALLCAFRDAMPDRRFPWRPPPYEYEYEKMPIDILAGSDGLRRAIDAGATPQEVSVTCRLDAGSFDVMRSACLLY